MTGLRALLPLFFLSGATSLVYQTVWARQLHLVLGTSSFAITTVLAAFMAGLGAGGLIAARSADRVRRPLRAYAILELGIGLYALALPSLIGGVTAPLYLTIHRAWDPGPVMFGAIQGLLVGILLLPPTAAMGATLPLLARLAVDRLGRAGERIGLLYGVNTAGAVLGTAAAGLWLLPSFGLWSTTVATATGNLILAAVAWGLGADEVGAPEDDLERDLIDGAIDPDRTALGLVGAAGMAALILEVAWARLVGLVLGGTTYAFTAMLLAVLLGIALGGRYGGLLADQALRRGGTGGVLRSLAAVQIGVAALCWGATFVWGELPYWFVWLYDGLAGSVWSGAPYAASMVLCVLVMLPPAALMGAAFPMAVRAAAGDGASMGRPVALAYAANTLGGVVGAIAAGFVLLPLWTLRSTVAVAAGIDLLAAGVALARAGDRPQALAVLAAVAVPFALPAPWDPLWMSGGMHHYVSQFDSHSREGIRWFATGDQELLFYREGLSTVVTVGRNTQTGNRWLANNGKVDASSSGDMPTQVLCALLATQHVQRDDSEGLVIGLASGVTAGAAAQTPGIAQLEVVELEAAIFEAAAFFEAENFGVLSDPRVRLVANDGRNHVLRAPAQRWDWVVSEPPNPYLSGVANLFTRDFWRIGRTRLRPGGVWAQWVQLYGMGTDDAMSLLRTFAHVFPHVALYGALEETDRAQVDLVLVGSDRPIHPSFAAAEGLLADREAAEALRRVGVDEAADLVAMHLMDRDGLLAYVGEGPEVTDDNMRIEYSAPLYLHRDTQVDNWDRLAAAAQVPWEHLPDDAERLEALARSYAARGDERRAGMLRAGRSEADPQRPPSE